MKNKILYIIAITCALNAGCKKELNQTPISTATTGTFFASNVDFVNATNAVYSDLRAYPDRLLNLSETRSDNLYAVADGPRDWEPINNFARAITANAYVQEAWNTNFNGIYRANTLLDKLNTNGSVITDAALKTRLTAETRFLRAFFYFDLVRLFGKVPIADKVVSVNEAASIPRSPVSAVYNFIIDDLKYAADNLPETYTGADKGRATKYAAKGILALVYMTRSGPTYNIEGPGLATNDWQAALDLLNEVINSGKYSFLSSYSDIFSYTNENNAEVIFDIQYSNGSNPIVGATFPWVLVPDNYFTSIGKTAQGGLVIRPVSNDLVNTSYTTSDVRRSFNVFTAGYTAAGATEIRPFFKKYVDITRVPTNSRLDWPINYIVMRYTDVLMLKAECILRGASGSQADVDGIMNQVRRRAGLTGTVSGTTLAQLMEERRREFAAEGLRWHDLVRSGLVTSVMPAWIAKDDVSKSISPFENNFIIYPVPQAELNTAPGLYTQNAGY